MLPEEEGLIGTKLLSIFANPAQTPGKYVIESKKEGLTNTYAYTFWYLQHGFIFSEK